MALFQLAAHAGEMRHRRHPEALAFEVTRGQFAQAMVVVDEQDQGGVHAHSMRGRDRSLKPVAHRACKRMLPG